MYGILYQHSGATYVLSPHYSASHTYIRQCNVYAFMIFYRQLICCAHTLRTHSKIIEVILKNKSTVCIYANRQEKYALC